MPTAFSEDEQVEVRETSCAKEWKLFLKADGSQVDQQYEDVERKMGMLPNYYFP